MAVYVIFNIQNVSYKLFKYALSYIYIQNFPWPPCSCFTFYKTMDLTRVAYCLKTVPYQILGPCI